MEEEEAEPGLGVRVIGRRWRAHATQRLLAGAPSIPACLGQSESNCRSYDGDKYPNYTTVQQNLHQQSSAHGRHPATNQRPYALDGISTESRFAHRKSRAARLWPLLVSLLLLLPPLLLLLMDLEPVAAQASWQHNDLDAQHNSSLDVKLMGADYDNDNINEAGLTAPDYDQISSKRSVGTPGNSSTWSLLVAALIQFEPTTGEFVQLNWANVLLALLLVLLMVTTAVGNLFVIVAILIERNLRIVGNYLVLSLAIADLLVALLVMPLASISQILHQWTLGLLLCDIWTSADVFCCTASILHLLAIALDRYWAVTRVNYIRCQRNERRILFMILFVWLTSSVISLAPVLGWKDDKFEVRLFEGKECLLSQDIGYQLFATSTTFYFPVTLTLIFYWKIYQVARKRIRRKLGNRVKVALQQPSSTSSASSPPAKVHSGTAAVNALNQLQQSASATVAPPFKSIVVDYVPSPQAGAANFSSSICNYERDAAAGRSLECACSCHEGAHQTEGDNQKGSPSDGCKTDLDLQQEDISKRPSEETSRLEIGDKVAAVDEQTEGEGTRKLSASESHNYAQLVQCTKCKRINQMLYQQHPCRTACFKHRSSSASRNMGSSLASCSRASSLAAYVAPGRANNAADEMTNNQQQQDRGDELALSPDGSLDDSSLMQISAGRYGPTKEAQQTGEKSQNASESNLNGLIECDCCACNCCDVNLNGADEMGADHEGAEQAELQAGEQLNGLAAAKNGRLLSESKQMPGTTEANRAITFHDQEPERDPKRETFSEPAVMQENGLMTFSGPRRPSPNANGVLNGNTSYLIAICWRRLLAIQQGARTNNTRLFGRRQNSLQPTLESSATTCDDFDDDQPRANSASTSVRHQLLVSTSGKDNCDSTTILMAEPTTTTEICKLCGCVAKRSQRALFEREVTGSKDRDDVAFDLTASLRNQSHSTVRSKATSFEPSCATGQTGGRLETNGSQDEPASVAAVAVSSAQIAVSTTVRQVDSASGKVRVTTTPIKAPLANNNQSVSLQNHAANIESVESKRERKAFKTLAIITGVFVMCWLPFFIIALARPLLDFQPSEWFQGFILWLGYFNSMLNPIIYTIFSPDFRKAFKRLLCRADHSSPSHANLRKSPITSNRSRGSKAGDRSQVTNTSDNQHSPIGQTGKSSFANEICVSRNWNGNEQVKGSKNTVVHDFA